MGWVAVAGSVTVVRLLILGWAPQTVAQVATRPGTSACKQTSMLYDAAMKVTIDLDPDLYRSLKVESARADRSVRDVVADAIAAWLERQEADEDRASAAEAL